nr:sodium:calcium symporter [Candidatus Goldiibacteriota bacterium]
TSSISMLQPAIAFFEDEFNASRKKAVFIIGIVTFIMIQPAIFFIGKGVVDELDFWGGTFALVLFATFEVIMFSWVFGIDKAWEEAHKGAKMKVPQIYKFILKYVTPLFLVFILVGWFVQQGIPFILMKGVEEANKPYIIGTRIGLLVLLLLLIVMVKVAWKKRRKS